jgi:hypothetical protein
LAGIVEDGVSGLGFKSPIVVAPLVKTLARSSFIHSAMRVQADEPI